MSARSLVQLAGPVALVAAAALVGLTVSRATEIYVINALVMVSIVVETFPGLPRLLQ